MKDQKETNNIIEQVFGILLILGGLIGFKLLFQNSIVKEKATDKQTEQKFEIAENPLSVIWKKDFQEMSSEESAPFKKVNSLKVFMLDRNLHTLLEGLKPPITTKMDKPLQLEVSFMTHRSEIKEKDMLIIQYNFIDTVSENMILEMSRQIELTDNFLAKKKPSQKTN